MPQTWKEKSLRKVKGLACAALVASTDKARTHTKIVKLCFKKEKENRALSRRCTAFPKMLLLENPAF